MAFLPVGVDENNKFPPAVQADLNATYVRPGDSTFAPPVASIQATPELGYVAPVMPSPPTLTVGAHAGAAPYTGITLAADTTQVTRKAGRYGTQFIDSKNWLQNYINNPSTSRSQGDIEFTFSGLKFAVHVNALLTTGGIRLWVDGQLYAAAPLVTHTSGASRSQNWVTVEFSASSVRRIRIEFPSSLFGGLNYESTAAATPIVGRPRRVAVFGDSWAAGTSDLAVHDAIYSRLGYELGWETARLGHGGSGYIQTGSGSGLPYTAAERLSELVAYQPDYVVIIGSLNDDAQSASAVGAAAEALYASIAAQLPTARLIVVGPQATKSTVPASRLANRDAIKAAAQNAGNVVRFIDPIALEWITGSGTVAAPAGDGNADQYVLADGLHLNTAGASYWANRLAIEILRVG